jgi:acetyl-CoA acetyltransferase
VGGELQFEAPHGYVVPPQWIVMWARRHQHVYGSTCDDLGQIAIQQRSHAVPNPHAINRTPLSIDDYLAGCWVNEPFRIFDCAYEVDGAVAVLLTSGDVLARMSATAERLLCRVELPRS